MIEKLCSKSFKLGFSSMWTKNFHMYKLGLKKAKELGIKFPTFVWSQKRQGDSRKTSTSASLTMWKPLIVLITTNCKILQEVGIPDHLTYFFRNLHAGQEAIVEPDMGQWTGSKLGKGYGKVIYGHPSYLTSIQSTLCKMPGWVNYKLKSIFPREISTTCRYADDTILMAEREEE